MSLADAITRFTVKVDTQSKTVFAGLVGSAYESITKGSAITGAPGQPVDTGDLVSSWQPHFLGPLSAEIVTNSKHAPQNEDGIARPGGGPYIQRSPTGGRHSVALTIAGVPKLLAAEVEKLP